MTERRPSATVEEQLRIVPGFQPGEHEKAIEVLSGKLDRRLERFPADEVELELSVKERETRSQRVVLEAWIAGEKKMVATSTRRELWSAVAEVRDDLFRQIDRAVNRATQRRSRSARP